MLKDTQLSIERQYNKRQKYPFLKEQLLNTKQIVNLINKHFTDDLIRETVIDILVTLTIMSNVSIQAFLETIHKPNKDDFENNLDLIFKLFNIGLLKLDIKSSFIRIVSLITIPPDVLEIIEKYKYLPPMLVKPVKLKTNKCSGYLTINTDSLILQKGNHHDEDINLDHLNTMNDIDLCLDVRVIKAIRDTQNHLDSKKEDETQEAYENRIKNFLRLEKQSFDVFAQLINNGNNFNLTHKYDKRGRCYSQGYHCNYQGNSYRKAIIQLVDKELIK